MTNEELENTSKALDEVLEVLQKYNLTAQSLVILYGNLGYSLGASIDGYQGGEGPSYEELEKKYYSEPTIGTSMMLQGLLVTSWNRQLDQENDGNNDEKETE